MKNHFLFLLLIVLVLDTKSLRTSSVHERDDGLVPKFHDFSAEVSAKLAEAIKLKLIQNMNEIQNKTFGNDLTSDLFEVDDSKRVVTSVDPQSAADIFKIFNLQDPHCDTDNNGLIQGSQLKCFNKIWKSYVPTQ